MIILSGNNRELCDEIDQWVIETTKPNSNKDPFYAEVFKDVAIKVLNQAEQSGRQVVSMRDLFDKISALSIEQKLDMPDDWFNRLLITAKSHFCGDSAPDSGVRNQ